MKTNRLVSVWLLAILSGCGRQAATGGSGQVGTSNTASGQSACRPACDGSVFMRRPGGSGAHDWQKVQLTPSEATSLRNAMTQTKVAADPAKTHLHADRDRGDVVFTHDNSPDARHVLGGEPEVSFGTRGPMTSSSAVKIVATPAADQLLRQREQASHNH